MELRSPDSAANPYLAIAICLQAGLDGIKNKIDPPEAVNKNIFELSEKERKKYKIETLPSNLLDAVEELEKDELIKDALGPHVAPLYISGKKREWAEYSEQVTQWETDRYLYKY